MALSSDQPASPSAAVERNAALTPWKYWLRKCKELCPHLEDLTPTHQSSKIRVLNHIGQGGHSRVVQVEIDGGYML